MGADQGIDERGEQYVHNYGGMPPRELLVQSEANNYSTAIASTENHDSMLWLICCMKPKCTVGHLKQDFVPLPGSAFAFLVVLHLHACCTGIEESWFWTGSGGLQLLGSLASLLKATLGKHVVTIILQ